MRVAEPIVEKVQDNISALKVFEKEILESNNEKFKDTILNFPIVYIHNWKSKNDYEVYVGESNNIFQRTRQHYSKMPDENEWQHNLSDGNANLYVIGHEHFNKSMTLDIENRLIHYLMSAENIKKVHNGRNNPQNRYYPIEELDDIFAKI